MNKLTIKVVASYGVFVAARTALPLIDTVRHEALRTYFKDSSLAEVMAVSQSWDFFPLEA